MSIEEYNKIDSEFKEYHKVYLIVDNKTMGWTLREFNNFKELKTILDSGLYKGREYKIMKEYRGI